MVQRKEDFFKRRVESMKSTVIYIIKKFAVMILILFVASFLIFFLMRANNIDEVSVIGTAKHMTEETKQALVVKHHLDEPLIKRYGLWLVGALHGDFGKDYQNNLDVVSQVEARMPITAGLVILSVAITLIVAIPIGIICAVKRNTWLDTLLSIITLLLTSIPDFLLGIIMIVLLVMFVPGYQFVGTYTNFNEYLSRIFIPSLALAGGMLAGIARVTRSSMIEQLKSGYVVAEEAKGMSSSNIIIKHAFHNACLPVLTVVSLLIGIMISGTVLIENVFSLPGVGSLLVTAVQQYNYPLIQYLTLIMLGVFLLISYIVDVLYVIIDPRTRKKH